MSKKISNNNLEVTLLEYRINELEKEHKDSLVKYSDLDLLKMSPEIIDLLPAKLNELESDKKSILSRIKMKFLLVRKVEDGLSRWFAREWVKVTDIYELTKVEKQMGYFKRLKYLTKNKKPKGWIDEITKEQALSIPIENIINQHSQLKKAGQHLVGLCPFHKEKTSSFYVYQNNNNFYWFGCHKGGDVITFVRLLYGFSFKEAIQHLIKGQ